MRGFILKQQALDAVRVGFKRYYSRDGQFATPYDSILDTIGLIRCTELTPVVCGEWIESDHGSYICSVCGEDWMLTDGTPSENHMRYCPSCGAKMDGEAIEE